MMTKFSWGCHTCDESGVRTFHYSRWGTRFAKRKSMRHERDVHGFSVYDPAHRKPVAR